MALISCPECQTEISDKASSCPKCGHPALYVVDNKKWYKHLFYSAWMYLMSMIIMFFIHTKEGMTAPQFIVSLVGFVGIIWFLYALGMLLTSRIRKN